MSRSKKQKDRDRRLRIREVRRDPPDLKKLAGALIALAQAQAETNAAAEHTEQQAACHREDDNANPQPSSG
ncbi:MAG TPA: hypothetical protein VK988_18570, partial [Acidimicrobiales bacterium]|nr:hypothetical protein [Acidimicrobiales bacterium]